MPKKKTTKPKKIKKTKKIEIPKEVKPYWWEEQRDKAVRGEQEYDESFFEPYFNALEPKLPADYKDPIFDEEWKILNTSTPNWENAGPGRLNIPALFEYYDKNIMPDLMKDTLTAILTPTGGGMCTMHYAVGLNTALKPRHRIHTVQGHNIGVLRNMLVDMAMQHKDTTHFLFVDSDTVLPPYGLVRMLRRDEDIMTGVYTMKMPPYVPLIIKRPKDAKGNRKYNYYIKLTQQLLNKTFEIDATGAGCLLIKREVLEKMGPPWFQVTPQESGLSAIGEDLFFFDKAKDMGYKVWMDTSVQCDHIHGGISYPQIFFSGNLVMGPQAAKTIDIWNKNAILFAQGLPFIKQVQPSIQTTAEAPAKQIIPEAVEQKEVIGDGRGVE